MNKVFLIGRLTKDPELTTTNSGVAVCRFSLAINREYRSADGEKATDFFDIIVWRALGENCQKYLKKGQQCAVVGRIENRSYDAQDGTKRRITEIVADSVEFLSRSGEVGGESVASSDEPRAIKPSKTQKISELVDTDEDLPF